MKGNRPFYQWGSDDGPLFDIHCGDFHCSIGTGTTSNRNDDDQSIDWTRQDSEEDKSSIADSAGSSTYTGETVGESTVEGTILSSVTGFTKKDVRPAKKRQVVEPVAEDRQDSAGLESLRSQIEALRSRIVASDPPTEREGNEHEAAVADEKIPIVEVAPRREQVTTRSPPPEVKPAVSYYSTQPTHLSVNPSTSFYSSQSNHNHQRRNRKKSSFYSSRSVDCRSTARSTRSSATRSVGLKKQGRSSKGTKTKNKLVRKANVPIDIAF